MWLAWERREKCSRFWRDIRWERDRSEDQGIDGIKIDPREISWECME
jgi:hypothetical protein